MIRPEVQKLLSELIANRRLIHQWPELKFEEHQTRQLIVDYLADTGLEIYPDPVAKTGLVALLRGTADPGKDQTPLNLGLRADMDALPVLEQETPLNGLYRSKNQNAHVCGHDAHVAMLLCAAKVLASWKDRVAGTVKFIFQPGEEQGFGAKLMIEEGVLTSKIGGVAVDEIYGLHVWSSQLPGTVGVQSGPIMASSDRFYIQVQGKGGHGSMPHQTVDAVPIASTLVSTIQTIVSRGIDPLQSVVVSVGTIRGGYAPNVISDSVYLEGTVRTFTKENQDFVIKRLEEICEGIGIAYRAKIELTYKIGYPATINSQEQTEKLRRSAEKIAGPLVGPPSLSMAAEDFSYFLQAVPGCFFFLGSSPGTLPTQYPHHSPQFDIVEDCLPIGASVFVQLVEDLLVPTSKKIKISG